MSTDTWQVKSLDCARIAHDRIEKYLAGNLTRSCSHAQSRTCSSDLTFGPPLSCPLRRRSVNSLSKLLTIECSREPDMGLALVFVMITIKLRHLYRTRCHRRAIAGFCSSKNSRSSRQAVSTISVRIGTSTHRPDCPSCRRLHFL